MKYHHINLYIWLQSIYNHNNIVIERERERSEAIIVIYNIQTLYLWTIDVINHPVISTLNKNYSNRTELNRTNHVQLVNHIVWIINIRKKKKPEISLAIWIGYHRFPQKKKKTKTPDENSFFFFNLYLEINHFYFLSMLSIWFNHRD